MADSYDEMDYDNMDMPVQHSRSQSRSRSPSRSSGGRSYSRSRSRSPHRSSRKSKSKKSHSSHRRRRSRSRSEDRSKKVVKKERTSSSSRTKVKKESRRARTPSSDGSRSRSDGRRTPSDSMSGSRTPSPENNHPRSVDRHGNKIVRLKDRLGGPKSHTKSPFNQEARVNIYERPHGPRTGIGYVKAGILEVRFVVPSKVAGSVIGKGGDLVQQLRKKHDCEIGVPVSDDSIDRVVVVRGKSVRNVIDCVCSIADYPLKKEMCRGLNLQPDCSQIRLLLHQTICGNVIGKGGEIIHEIRTEAGTDVHMYNEVCPRSTDRICRITGKINEIRDALAMIFKFTGDTNTKGRESDYDAKNSTGNEDGRDYGGWRLSEVRHMGAAEHSDDYAHNKRRKPKYDRHGNLRADNLTEHTRDKKRGRSSYDSDSDGDDPQRRIQREIKQEFNSRSRSGRRNMPMKPPINSNYQGNNYNPNFVPSRGHPPRGGGAPRGHIRSTRGGSRDRHGNKKVKSYRDRDDEDAPVYEGPNSSGPNRSDRKREHPLTALDLKRMNDREEMSDKKRRMRGLLDDE